MMICMCHFGTFHRKKSAFFCFVFLLRQQPSPDSVQMCNSMSLFFFLLRLSRGSVNAQEQTSSTRLELQLLLFTLIRMEIRLTEAHRKLRLIITMKLVSCRSHSHYCCISFSINIGRQFTVFTSDFII